MSLALKERKKHFAKDVDSNYPFLVLDHFVELLSEVVEDPVV